MYVKTLPVYCNLDSSATELLTSTKNQLMDSMDHDIYSFSEISRAFGITSDIIFVYQGDNFEFDTLAGLPAKTIEVISEGAIASISVEVSIKDEKFHFRSTFRGNQHEDSSMDALLTNLALAAKQVLTCNDLSQIQLLFDEEQSMVDDPRFKEQTFVDLFCSAAEKFPDHIAVKDKKGSITYAQLDAASGAGLRTFVRRGGKRRFHWGSFRTNPRIYYWCYCRYESRWRLYSSRPWIP